MDPQTGKQLLGRRIQFLFQRFLRDETTSLTVPSVSPSPFHAASTSATTYTKIDFAPTGDHTLRCIKKGKKTHSWVWLTSGEKIKKAVRWGIIRPESLIGKLIATIGAYRHTTYQRVAKGMMTRTQGLKLQLVDHYQDRLELLSQFESMVNGNHSSEAYTKAFKTYESQLDTLHIKLQTLRDTQLEELLPGTLLILEEALQDAKKRANAYLKQLTKHSNFDATNRARGQDSILEYVKQESLQFLYELQGLNQDLTFSRARRFALTRGELNDAIEDARKVIDDHRADPKNRVTAQHHQSYLDDMPVAFHLDPNEYTPTQERAAVMAISFIEGWDQFHPTTQSVMNDKGETETLDIIAATKWQPHRTWKSFFKSLGYFLFHVMKGFFLPTHPKDEEAWKTKGFHLYSHSLHKHTRPNTHIWWKVFAFIKYLAKAVYDLFDGIRDFASNLIIRLPQSLVNDWASTNPDESLDDVYKEANEKIDTLLNIEKMRLDKTLQLWQQKDPLVRTTSSLAPSASPPLPLPPFAKSPYPLTAGEQNDLLTAMVRGVDGFASYFTHNIYSKDPVGAMIFTLAYACGGAALYFPEISKAIFGQGYVDWFTEFAKTMGSTKFAGMIAGASTQAQMLSTAWDLILQGPNSGLVEGTKDILKDPITIAAGFWLAYGMGYLLANGINGYDIPGVSEYFREEMGTVPSTTYPITGAKILITLYEVLHTPHHPLLENIKEKIDDLRSNHTEVDRELKRIQLVHWLHQHAEALPHLGRSMKFKVAQQIEGYFAPEEARSLKTILYPEKPRSIAFQLFYIPLSYIPALVRLIVACVMSLVALGKGNPHPWRPIRRAATDLGKKIAYDLQRLLIFMHELLRLIFKCVACIFKALAFTINLCVGRIGGLFKAHPGHYIHQAFAAVHRGFAWVREFIFPAQITTSVQTRHARCTLDEVTTSHHAFMTRLSSAQDKTLPASNDTPTLRIWRTLETQTEPCDFAENVEVIAEVKP